LARLGERYPGYGFERHANYARRMRIESVPEPQATPEAVDVFLTVEEADLLLQSLQV